MRDSIRIQLTLLHEDKILESIRHGDFGRKPVLDLLRIDVLPELPAVVEPPGTSREPSSASVSPERKPRLEPRKVSLLLREERRKALSPGMELERGNRESRQRLGRTETRHSPS